MTNVEWPDHDCGDDLVNIPTDQQDKGRVPAKTQPLLIPDLFIYHRERELSQGNYERKNIAGSVVCQLQNVIASLRVNDNVTWGGKFVTNWYFLMSAGNLSSGKRKRVIGRSELTQKNY